MTCSSRFNDRWDPVILEEEVLTVGTWLYQGTIEHTARLIRRKWDYTVKDIADIEAHVDGIALDYVDYQIGADGNVYFWVFEGPAGSTESRTVGSYDKAQALLASFDGTAHLTWCDK